MKTCGSSAFHSHREFQVLRNAYEMHTQLSPQTNRVGNESHLLAPPRCFYHRACVQHFSFILWQSVCVMCCCVFKKSKMSIMVRIMIANTVHIQKRNAAYMVNTAPTKKKWCEQDANTVRARARFRDSSSVVRTWWRTWCVQFTPFWEHMFFGLVESSARRSANYRAQGFKIWISTLGLSPKTNT